MLYYGRGLKYSNNILKKFLKGHLKHVSRIQIGSPPEMSACSLVPYYKADRLPLNPVGPVDSNARLHRIKPEPIYSPSDVDKGTAFLAVRQFSIFDFNILPASVFALAGLDLFLKVRPFQTSC